MDKKILKEIFETFYPLLIILLLIYFKYISINQVLIGYLLYCIYVYIKTQSRTYYCKTQFNQK